MQPNKPSSQPAEYLTTFEKLLPTEVLFKIVQSCQPDYYERVLTPLVLLWAFIYQKLSGEASCGEVLTYLESGKLDQWDQQTRRSGKPSKPLSERVSPNTSAYCQGRERLSLDVMSETLRESSRSISEQMGEDGYWKGYNVSLLDGTTLLLQASPDLIEHYGRHTNQHGASHWPLLRMVTSFNLQSAALEQMEEDTIKVSEQELTRRMLQKQKGAADSVAAPRVYVADSNFGVYSVMASITESGADALVRLTPVRMESLLKRLDQPALKPGEEREICWTPTAADRRGIKEGELPPCVKGRLLYVRLERDGFMPKDLYFFTTLDKTVFSLDDVVELYGKRWHVELNLRYVKSELGLYHLSSRKAEMVAKELTAGMIAYNLIRGFMAMAARRAGISPLRLSFKECWRRIDMFGRTSPLQATPKQIAERMDWLLQKMGACTILKRKPRHHPRNVRGKPRAFPLLIGERHRQNNEI
jgi:hypothetical protein